MKLIFAGTPDFAVPTLQALIDSDHDIQGVYTQPDRPAGRGQSLTQSPVKQCALAAGLNVLQPLNFRESADIDHLSRLQPDIMVVVAYGLILPKAVLDIPKHGCLNVHASLLPRWRGAAPIQRSIEHGDHETGITIMQMDIGLDTGGMLKKVPVTIDDEMTAQDLHDELSMMGGSALLEIIDAIERGLAPEAVQQQDELATYANKLTKQEAQIDWSIPAVNLHRQVRAFNPWPVSFTRFMGKRLRVWSVKVENVTHDSAPGTILEIDEGSPVIACGEGALRLIQVQPEGKKKMSARDFLNSRRGQLVKGTTFG